jgi:hypothetical protein
MVACLDWSSNLSDVGGSSFGFSNLRTTFEFLQIGPQHTLMPFLSSLCTGPLCFSMNQLLVEVDLVRFACWKPCCCLVWEDCRP